jgi:hypothetical protein
MRPPPGPPWRVLDTVRARSPAPWEWVDRIVAVVTFGALTVPAAPDVRFDAGDHHGGRPRPVRRGR